jgi:hypothetical protein
MPFDADDRFFWTSVDLGAGGKLMSSLLCLYTCSKRLTRVFVASLVIAGISGPGQVFADGMAWDSTSFRPLSVEEQRALIRHNDGVQRMLIALDLERKNAVWMFPVPGGPDQVKVDVSDSFPILHGPEVRNLASRNSPVFWWVPLLTQVPNLITPVIVIPYYISYKASQARDVTTHRAVEKFGVHAEVISAQSPEGLRDYFDRHGLSTSADQLKPFRDYLSARYVMVVAWIASDVERGTAERQLEERASDRKIGTPCLFVQFPTERAYYPLKPTSGYGQESVQVTLRVLGFVSTDYRPLERSTSLRPGNEPNGVYGVYYVDGKAQLPTEDGKIRYDAKAPSKDYLGGAFGDLSQQGLRYTLVSMRCPAECFTEDLWFSSDIPRDVDRALLTLKAADSRVIIALHVLLLSLLSGAISGQLLFGRWHPYGVLGAFNLLTLIGVGLAVHAYRERLAERSRAFRFVLVYTVVFHALTFALFAAAPWCYH